jgi:ABC-type glutathione transport system ATPase component
VHADQILVLAHGAIVDRGTHEELASRPGPYLEMWRRQSGHTDVEETGLGGGAAAAEPTVMAELEAR